MVRVIIYRGVLAVWKAVGRTFMVQITWACLVYIGLVVFFRSGRIFSLYNLFLLLSFIGSPHVLSLVSLVNFPLFSYFVSEYGWEARTLSLEYLSTQPDYWYDEPDVDYLMILMIYGNKKEENLVEKVRSRQIERSRQSCCQVSYCTSLT